jgi:hypothetical protein
MFHLNEATWVAISAIASAALAVVTGLMAIFTRRLAVETKSMVYETRTVVSGEDRRFQQSRIPVVVVQENNTLWVRLTDGGEIALLLENIGEGAAVEVYLTLKAKVHYLLSGRDSDGQNFTDRSVGDEPIDVNESFLFSYLPVRTPCTFVHKLKHKEREFRVGLGDIDFEALEVKFNDTFGARYSVQYPDFKNRPNHFERILPASVKSA